MNNQTEHHSSIYELLKNLVNKYLIFIRLCVFLKFGCLGNYVKKVQNYALFSLMFHWLLKILIIHLDIHSRRHNFKQIKQIITQINSI